MGKHLSWKFIPLIFITWLSIQISIFFYTSSQLPELKEVGFPTFCIPGTFIFNLLGGALFGIWVGFPVCVLCNTLGAFFCFNLSKFFGQEIVENKLKKQFEFLKKKVDDNRKDLFFFMLSTRVFPGSPNWLMNITFPHMNIPSLYFALSIFFGLMPWNFMTVEAGKVISTFKSKDEIMQPQNYIMLMSLALLCVIPSLVKKCLPKKKEEIKQN